MKIFVKTLKGTHFEIEVKPDDSVADVKKNIETVQGANVYPAGKLMLTHQGKVLKDETTIEENKVAENAFIVIMMTKSKPASTGAGASSASDAPAVQAKSMPTSSTQPSTSPQPPASVAIPAAPAPAAATEIVAAPVPESVSATPPASTPALESTPTESQGDIGLPATMAPPLLKLVFVNGPRDGECFEYKAGSVIGIGRVVSGNKITVKEAGISSKHLRIVFDSENWIIEDLGSSNGTIVNMEVLDPRIPVNLHHGDIIKIGELTSIIVKFETDVTAEEPKLPPRPGRNNRRLPVGDPDPVQEKPTGKGRSAKQDEDQPAKRRKAKVGRPRKKVAIRKEEEEVAVEKKGNSRAQGGKKNTEAVQNSGFEDTPSKGVEISAMIRSRQIGKRLEENVKSEDTAFEEMRGPSRATRSKKKEIGGDSFKELDMVLSQARAKNKKKKMKQKQSDSAVEEIDITLDESDCKAGVETSDGVKKAEQESWNENNLHKADLEKMTLGEWFKYMEVYLRKQIVDETEKMIEEMRSRSRRVHQYIAEQKQAKGKGKESTS